MKNRGLLLLIMLLTVITGCVTERLPPISTYILDTDFDIFHPLQDKEQQAHDILKLARISSTSAFNDTDIVYSDMRYGQNSYAYSRWSDSPASMLLVIFQEALEKSGGYMAVVPYSSQSRSDLLLESTLIDFSQHINDDGASQGTVRMRFNLIDNRKKRVIASRDFITSAPAPSNNAIGAVAALNKAVADLTKELVEWLGQDFTIH
jgi:cholesterol transport system auxiliary component